MYVDKCDCTHTYMVRNDQIRIIGVPTTSRHYFFVLRAYTVVYTEYFEVLS